MKKGFKFGVEIECIVPRDYSSDITEKFTQLDVVCGSDPTIRVDSSHHIGKEYRTKPLAYNKMYRHIGQICDILKSYEAGVNQTCGLHLHASNIRFTSQKYLKRIIHVWVAIEDVLISTQPASRYGSNAYNRRMLRSYVNDKEIQSLPRQKIRLLNKVSTTRKQQNLNIKSLIEHTTIENRLHAGTTSKAKIRAWLELNRQFYIYCLTDYKPEVVTELFRTKISDAKIQKVFKLLGVSASTIEYYNTRIKKHLFVNLAYDQESAYKTLELMPEKERMVKQFQKARDRLDDVDRRLNDVSFQG